MELKRPVSTGSTSQSGDSMLHSAAMRVQARLDAEEHRNRAIARAKAMRTLFSWLLVLVLLLGGFVAWRKGLVDKILGESEPTTPSATAETDPEVKKAEAPVAEPAPAKAEAKGSTAKKPEAAVKSEERKAAPPKVDWLTEAKSGFANARVDYWKNAVAEDRPGKNNRLTFTGLVPDGKGAYTMLKMQLGGGQPLQVTMITINGESEPLDAKEYNMLIEKQPQLVVREGRAYFCSARKKEKKTDFGKVPAAGTEFNPSKEEFGDLYEIMRELKTNTSKFVYEVELQCKSLQRTFPVKKVGFGESLTSVDFAKAVASVPGDAVVREAVLDVARVIVK